MRIVVPALASLLIPVINHEHLKHLAGAEFLKLRVACHFFSSVDS